MFKKYSIASDCTISFGTIILAVVVFRLLNINLLSWKSQFIGGDFLALFGVLFGFILTIITILFMFDPSNNEIFKKLKKDGTYSQIFARFFDSIIVVFLGLIYFILINIYSFNSNFYFWRLEISTLNLVNFISLAIILWTFIRIYRCLNLLSLVYKALGFKN